MDTKKVVEEVLAHHGIKGQKWGVRRKNPSASSAADAHPDAIRVNANKKTAKKSSTDALSTKDLQELVTRMNLEQQYSRLASQDKQRNAGAKFATDLLGNVAKQQATRIANESAAKAVAKLLAKNAVKIGAAAL